MPLASNTSHPRPPPPLSPQLPPIRDSRSASYMAASSGRRAWQLLAALIVRLQRVGEPRAGDSSLCGTAVLSASAGRRQAAIRSLHSWLDAYGTLAAVVACIASLQHRSLQAVTECRELTRSGSAALHLILTGITPLPDGKGSAAAVGQDGHHSQFRVTA